MHKFKQKREKKIRRRQRARAKILGSANRPRLSVFRSNQYVWTQLIDDESGKTLVAVSGLGVKGKKSVPGPSARMAVSKPSGRDGGSTSLATKGLAIKKKEVLITPMALAQKVGELLAEKAREKKINSAVFDRGPYKYHGLIKAVAEGARKGGLKF